MAQYCYDYPRPSVTTDICLFTVVEDDLRILLIRRGLEPFKGAWALPGGFLQETETLDQCAARELREETGVDGAHLEAFATFSDPKRDPRYRVVTAAYFALVPAADHALQSGSDADDAKWYSMAKLPKLAFDHNEIILAARQAPSSSIGSLSYSLCSHPALRSRRSRRSTRLSRGNHSTSGISGARS